MSRCTAPVTGKHKDARVKSKCPVCGVANSSRRAPADVSMRPQLSAPAILSPASINARLGALETIGRELSERECAAIAVELRKMSPTRQEDVLDNYLLVDGTPGQYEGFEVEGYGPWEAMARERYAPSLPSWLSSGGVDDGIYNSMYRIAETLIENGDEIWTFSDESEGEHFWVESFESPQERSASASASDAHWEGRIVALFPPTDLTGEILDVESLRAERMTALGISYGNKQARGFLADYPMSEVYEGSDAMESVSVMFPEEEK